MPGTVRHQFPFLSAGQAQKELIHNEALALIDIAAGAAVVSAGSDAPPATPQAGECWIVGDAPTGGWVGQAGAIACWSGNGWRFLPPVEGMRARVLDLKLDAVREQGVWRIGPVDALSVEIEGMQVVGARQPAIADPAGGGVIDIEARAAIAALLAGLRTHGLIAT